MTNLTPDLCRAARALLGWNAADLAGISGVGVATIRRYELGNSAMYEANQTAIVDALRQAGVVLIQVDEHGGAGVRRAG